MDTSLRRTIAATACVGSLLAVGATGANARHTGASADPPTYPGASTSIPWDRVGQGWTVFRYATAADDPVGRYHLVSPAGVVHATDTSGATALDDVSDDGTHVPQETFEEVNDGKYVVSAHALDLRSGRTTGTVRGGEDATLADLHFIGPSATQHAGTFAGMGGFYDGYARTTRTQWLFSTIDSGGPWTTLVDEEVLPTNDGRSTVVGADERLRRVNNSTGEVELSWAIPSSYYRACAPTRWWSQNSMVADCRSAGGKHSVYLRGPTGSSERLTTWAGRQGAGITDAWYRKGGWMIVDSPVDEHEGTTVLRHTTKNFPAVATGYARADTTPMTVIGDDYYATVALEDGTRIIRNDLVTHDTRVLARSGPSGQILDAHTINLRD